jgi:hypothetical protein
MPRPETPVDGKSGISTAFCTQFAGDGTFRASTGSLAIGEPAPSESRSGGAVMNGIIYLVGLIVVIMFILSFLGLR